MVNETDTAENQQVELAHSTRTIGVLLPGSRVSVKVSNDTTTIKPSWHRWVPPLICLVLALLHIAPLIIGHFLIPETSPKKREMMTRAILLALFSLLWFWLAFSQILRNGKISWQAYSPGLLLQCGHLFRHRSYTLFTEGLLVKMYMYKANRPNVRLRYGRIILSLVKPEQPNDELIVAVVKNKKTAEHAFKVLRDFLGQGIDETSIEESDLASDSLLADIESAAWNELAKKSRIKSPFFGSMRRKSVSIKEYPERLVLKWFWDRWIMALFLLGLSGSCFLGAFLVFDFDIRGIFASVSGLGLGCLFGYPGVRILLAAHRITLENWNSTTTIRYGSFPFAKILILGTEQIIVRMYRCDASLANRAIKPGYTLLSLSNNKSPNSEFIIAAASKKTLITPMYEKLTEFLKQPYSDELLEEVELPGGEIIKVSKESLTGGGDSEDRKRTFRILSDNRAVFTRPWTTIVIGVGLAALFVALLIGFLLDMDEETALGGTIFMVALSLLFIALGAGVAIWSWRTRHIVVDISKNVISYKSLLRSSKMGKLICAIGDIAAVQVCSVLGTISSGKSTREVIICEINVVLRTSENKRINIVAGQNSSQIQNDAAQFAEFIGVPLFNHT